MRREELAWAAGLFEGEGCFCLSKGISTCPQLRQVRAVLTITDADVISRFAFVLGVGLIKPLKPRKQGHKEGFQWRVSSFEHFQYVVVVLWPWLGERRKAKALELLKIMQDYHARGSSQRGILHPRKKGIPV